MEPSDFPQSAWEQWGWVMFGLGCGFSGIAIAIVYYLLS